MASIKGLVLLDSIRMVRERDGEESLERIVQRVPDPWRGLLRGQLLPTTWYPLEAFVQLLDADLTLTGHGDPVVLMERAAVVIKAQLNDVYSVFGRHKSPAWLLERLATINETYFNGVTVSVGMLGPKSAEITYIGFASGHRVLETVLVTFYKVALTRAGAQNVVVKVRTSMGANSGRCELAVTWDEPQPST